VGNICRLIMESEKMVYNTAKVAREMYDR